MYLLSSVLFLLFALQNSCLVNNQFFETISTHRAHNSDINSDGLRYVGLRYSAKRNETKQGEKKFITHARVNVN